MASNDGDFAGQEGVHGAEPDPMDMAAARGVLVVLILLFLSMEGADRDTIVRRLRASIRVGLDVLGLSGGDAAEGTVTVSEAAGILLDELIGEAVSSIEEDLDSLIGEPVFSMEEGLAEASVTSPLEIQDRDTTK